MKSLGLLVLLFFGILLVSVVGKQIENMNGIPDVIGGYMPKTVEELDDLKALDTMTAPFAEAEMAAKPVELHPDIKYDPLGTQPSINAELNIQNLNEADVSEWTRSKVSEALTFTIPGIKDHAGNIKGFMSSAGIQEFNKFLDKTSIVKLMQSGNYNLYTSVLDVPVLRLQGPAGGRFSWLYEMPISLTFLPPGYTSYEGLESDQYRSELINVRVQVSRSAKGQGVEGLLIETWEALKRVN